MIIDPPSDFAPLEEWKTFLSDMEALLESDASNDDARLYLKMAKERIAEKSDTSK